MTAAWAAVILSGLLCAGAAGAFLSRAAYRAGRVEEAIARLDKAVDLLTGIAGRHDQDITDIRQLLGRR